MRQHYEDFWQGQPRDPEPWRYEWRRGLLERELRPGDHWIDLGCGAGRFLAVAPHAVGLELAPAAVERARRNAPEADVRLIEDDTLPVAHASADLVWCSEVIEHVPDALGLLQEVRRVLRPGGRLLLTTPGHPWLRRVALAAVRFDAHFDPMGQHVRFFTRESLSRTLVHAGLEPAGILAQRGVLIARAIRP